MAHVSNLIRHRANHERFDEDLWDFMTRASNVRNLVNVSDEDLRWRLAEIERNILFLDGPVTPRDNRSHDDGWLSPWWWWRTRHWTVRELVRRGAPIESDVEVDDPVAVRREFLGLFYGEAPKLVRISARKWILDSLIKGAFRFSQASSYNDAKLGRARADEEMAKAYLRPGQSLIMTRDDGRRIEPLGDVSFASRRAVERAGTLIDVPYWMLSFSTDLDPRLFAEFSADNGEDTACLVIFDPEAFKARLGPVLERAAPATRKQFLANQYFDPHFPPRERISAIEHKHFSYAYQREMRLVLDPEGKEIQDLNRDGVLKVEVGSIEDIAAAYEPGGARISGTGPASFLLDP